MNATQQSILVAELRDECECDIVCDYLARVAAAVNVDTHELHYLASNMDLARDAEQSDRLRLATANLARTRLDKLNLPAALREEGERLLLPVA